MRPSQPFYVYPQQDLQYEPNQEEYICVYVVVGRIVYVLPYQLVKKKEAFTPRNCDRKRSTSGLPIYL